MSDLEQLFQQSIEQFEAGEPLEICLEGLPEQEAKALHLIAAVRSIPIEDADDESIISQRAEVLREAAIRLNGTAASQPAPAVTSWLAQLKVWMDHVWTNWELSVGLAALFIFILVGLAWRGISQEKTSADVDVITTDSDIQDGAIAIEPTLPVQAQEETGAAPVVDSDPATASGASGSQGPAIYMPLVTIPLNLSPQTAVVDNVQGIVEIQSEAGLWTAVHKVDTIFAGQRIRTGALSKASISFYDGSQAYLGANTEISIDELNASRPEEGFRTVVMTQWQGDSDHQVQFRNDGGSRYEVKSPAGSGIARGTKFHVLVTQGSLTRYIVTEGKVDVTGQNRTVSVTAGQITTLSASSGPEEPAFNITGEGEVSAIGTNWTIAGQTFQTHEHTIIVGNPQIGDLVHVDGHLLPNGTRMADHIILLQQALSNRFNLSGEVEAMGETWIIAGQAILVNEQTAVAEGIAIGENVQVEGVIMAGGTLQARVISLLDETSGFPFQFSGVIQTMGNNGWTISGQSIVVDEETVVDDDIALGDVVMVRGWVREDGTWLATDIDRYEDELPSFEFTGIVQSQDPWQVAGIGFEARPWTVITPGISTGDLVRVQGTILSDGTWVAASITPLHDILPGTFNFIGIVASMDPWIVNGLPLVITNDTLILGNISIGSLVTVQAQLLSDGTWTVLRIQPLYPDFGTGCFILSTPVIAVNGDTIQVKHWNTNIARGNIQGDVSVNNIVTVPICTGWDGTVIIIGNIVVIYRPIIIIIDDGGQPLPPGCKISKNGGIKCSNKSHKSSK